MSTTLKVPVPVDHVGSLAMDVERLYGAIMARSYHYFLERGSVQGYDADDWVRAENELTVKPEFELARDGDCFAVKMVLPETNQTGLQIRVTPYEMLVSSRPDAERRRIFRIVRFPERIDCDAVHAALVGNQLSVIANKKTESAQPRSA